NLSFPGVEIGGSLDILTNTTGEDILWSVPVLLRGATGYDNVLISGNPQKLNPDFDPMAGGDLDQSALVPDTDLEPGPYFAIGGIAHANILSGLMEWDGAFFFSLS